MTLDVDAIVEVARSHLTGHLVAVAVFSNEEENTFSVGNIYKLPLETFARRAIFTAVNRAAGRRQRFVAARIHKQIVVYSGKNTLLGQREISLLSGDSIGKSIPARID